MSYYMEQLGHDFRISSANTAAAYGALKAWEQQEIARHPAYRQLGREPLNGADTLEDALAELGWTAEIDESGNITGLSFEGGKLCDEDSWLNAIAPYVQHGSRLEMRGEDGYLWCWYFNGESCTTYDGKVVFPDIPIEGKEQPICTM